MNDQKQIALVTVFWGKWYTDTFLNFCLPSLLSKFNLPEFKNFFSVRFIISTNKKNQNIINNSDVVQLLKKIVKVDFLLFEDNLIPEEIRGEDAYKSSIKKTQLLIQEQNRVLGESFRSDIGLIYIHSDCIYSNHSLVFIANSIQRGVKLIYVPGFRVSYESFASSNYGKNFQPSNNKNDFLVKNSVKHFPQYHKSQYWCSDSLTKYPSAHFWKRKDLTLVRLFHERIPFFISSTYSHINIKNGIDSDFDNSLYLFARSRGDKIEHVTDSRQVFVASLVSDNYELLERWRAQGNLEKAISYKSNIKKKSSLIPKFINRFFLYIKSFIMFHSEIQLFSSRHIYKIYINDIYFRPDLFFYFNEVMHRLLEINFRILFKLFRLCRAFYRLCRVFYRLCRAFNYFLFKIARRAFYTLCRAFYRLCRVFYRLCRAFNYFLFKITLIILMRIKFYLFIKNL